MSYTDNKNEKINKTMFLKYTTLFLLSTFFLHAEILDAVNPPLFAKVIDIAQNDTLNVRKEPDYRSRKVGSLPRDAHIGVEKCQKFKTSIWCRVYEISLNNYSDDFQPGWVNAKYLKPLNRGYVLLNGKKEGNCDYALSCYKGKCKVVKNHGYEMNTNGEITAIHVTWMKRNRLRGESRFGAANDRMDGYCGIDKRIDDYLLKNAK